MNTEAQREEVLAQKARVADTFRELVASSEALLKATANYTGSEIEELRERLTVQLQHAREHAHDLEGAAAQKYREYQRATEQYVQTNVWKSIGIAAFVGVLIGAVTTGGRRDDE